MANRIVALGIVALCVLALGLTAAGLPTVSPEPVRDGEEVESENASIGSGGYETDWNDNRTFRMPGQYGEDLNATESMVAALMAGVSDRLPGGFSGSDEASEASAGESSRRSLLTGPEGVLLVVGVVLVGAVLTLRSVSGSVDETAVERETDEEERAEAAATAAGRAADAVADADGDPSELSNAVYRAWYEMTAALDVADPETATPGEFAAAAREAGLDAGAVADLTTVFEAVRYGDEPVADHEDRALAALRRLERDADVADGAAAGDDADRPAVDPGAGTGGEDARSDGGGDG